MLSMVNEILTRIHDSYGFCFGFTLVLYKISYLSMQNACPRFHCITLKLVAYSCPPGSTKLRIEHKHEHV